MDLVFMEIFKQDSSTMVIDHISYAVSETKGEHTLIASNDLIKSAVTLGSTKIESVTLLWKKLDYFKQYHNTLKAPCKYDIYARKVLFRYPESIDDLRKMHDKKERKILRKQQTYKMFRQKLHACQKSLELRYSKFQDY